MVPVWSPKAMGSANKVSVRCDKFNANLLCILCTDQLAPNTIQHPKLSRFLATVDPQHYFNTVNTNETLALGR